MSITKNRQSPGTLHALAAAAFPDKQVRAVTELTEGMFNAAYRFDFVDDSASILKIAAASEEGLLSNEINLMQAEVSAMELLRGHGVPHIPQVQFSDFTRTRCSGTYFFMEVMPGRSLSSCKHELSEETVSTVMHEVGQRQRLTTDFHRARFGLAGDTRQFDSLYALVHYIFSNVLGDAARGGIDLGQALFLLLEKHIPIIRHGVTALLCIGSQLWDTPLQPAAEAELIIRKSKRIHISKTKCKKIKNIAAV